MDPRSSLEPSSQKANEEQLIAFRDRGEEFAFSLLEIREIIKSQAMTPVPNAPAAVRGVVNLRGKIMTVVELATVLGLVGKPSEDANIIVTESGDDLIGILVEEVVGVIRVPTDRVKPAPELAQSQASAHFVRGVITMEAANAAPRIIMVLQLKQVLQTLMPLSV